MTREYSNLHVASLDPEQHERTCGYWYTVTSGAMAHTAFASRAGLDRWLRERNLKLQDELSEQGVYGTSRVVGIGEWHGEPLYSPETIAEGLFDPEAFEQMPGQLAVDAFNARWERVSSPEAIRERAEERAEYEARYEAMMARKRAENES